MKERLRKALDTYVRRTEPIEYTQPRNRSIAEVHKGEVSIVNVQAQEQSESGMRTRENNRPIEPFYSTVSAAFGMYGSVGSSTGALLLLGLASLRYRENRLRRTVESLLLGSADIES